MKEEVRLCADAKKNVFQEYFDVPESVEPELEKLLGRIDALGEECSDAMEFETRFAEELQQEYNGMFLKVTPRARPMTEAEKEESERLSMELQYGTSDPKEAARKKAAAAAKDAIELAESELEQEVISMKRKAMIESGTFDDYTRATNIAEDARIIGKALGGLFKKKK